MRAFWATLAVVLVALAIFYRPIETALVQAGLGWATGDDVRVGSVENAGGGIVLEDAHFSSPDGAAQLAATRALLSVRGNVLALALASPRATVTVDRADSHEIARADDSLRRLGGGRDLALHVEDGSLVLVSADRPDMRIAADGIAGDANVTGGEPSYHFTLNLVAGDARYPISASAQRDDDGALVQRWSATRVPLDALESLHLTPAITFRGGSLDDLVVSYGKKLHAAATLDHVALSLPNVVPSPAGDPATTLALSKADPPTPPFEPSNGRVDFEKLRGSLVVDGDAAGTAGIVGTLDGVPFEIRGDVHDLGAPFDVIAQGSPTLHQLALMAGMVGAQSHLTFARLETTAPGVAFAQYGVTSPIGPHVVSLVDVDPKEPTLHFDTVLSADKVISKGERTSQLGARTSAVAGLNGDYFDIGRTYEPQGMLMRAGVLLHGPADRASLVIDKHANITFAEFHLDGVVTTPKAKFAITQLNSWPVGDTTIITPEYGDTLRADPGTTFARIEPVGDPAKHEYRVTSVEPAESELPVSLGIAFGRDEKKPLPRPGDRITMRYGLSPAVPDAWAGIGGGPILLKDGEWYEDPHAPAPDERDVRWPVDALGKVSDGSLLFVAVDGRHPDRSVGMGRPEFAALLQTFGVTDAMALDSGGSVTLVSRPPGKSGVEVRNVPSDDSAERYISDAIFVYSSASPQPVAGIDDARTAGDASGDAPLSTASAVPSPIVPSAPALATPAPQPT